MNTRTFLAPSGCDFDQVLLSNYDGLFRFGLTLTGSPNTALDLTQQTVYLALKSEGQLREPGKARSWLFTILYRAFLQTRRHQTRFPDVRTPRNNATPTRLPNETTAEPTQKPQSPLVSAAIY